MFDSSSGHSISQAGILEWVAFPSLGDIPDPGIKPVSPPLSGRFFATEAPGKPNCNILSSVSVYCMLELCGVFTACYKFVPLKTISLIPTLHPLVTTILLFFFLYKFAFLFFTFKWYHKVLSLSDLPGLA